MTDSDKIARLPQSLREKLNRRILKGEPAGTILTWLHTCPDVWDVLAKHFSGAPISHNNLIEWQMGGFADWKLRQEVAGDLQNPQPNPANSNIPAGQMAAHLADVLTKRYAVFIQNWNGEDSADFNIELRALSHLTRDVCALRKAEHQAARLQLEEKKFAFRQKLAEEDKQTQFMNWLDQPGMRQRILAHYGISTVPVPAPDASPETPDPSLRSSESDLIKPNQPSPGVGTARPHTKSRTVAPKLSTHSPQPAA